MPTKFCSAEGCEAEATETVDVSEHRPGDSKRHYCWTCSEVYRVGVQHGSLTENPNVYRELVKVPEPYKALDKLLKRLATYSDQESLQSCAGYEINAAKVTIAQHHAKRNPRS